MAFKKKQPPDRSFSMAELLAFSFAITLSLGLFRVVHDAGVPSPSSPEYVYSPIPAIAILAWLLFSGALGIGSFTLLFGRRSAAIGACLVPVVGFILLVLVFAILALLDGVA